MADITSHDIPLSADGKPRRHLSETLVMAAMCVVTVAFGAALYMQVGLTLWLTFIAALSLYVTLLTLHALVRRSDIVESLNSEIRRLEVEIARITGQNPAHSAVQNRNSHVASRAPVPPPLTPAKPVPRRRGLRAAFASAGLKSARRKHGTPISTRRRHTHARPARYSRPLHRQLHPQPRRHRFARKRLRPRPPRRLHSQGQPVLRRRSRHTSPGPSVPPIPTSPPLMAICRRRSH